MGLESHDKKAHGFGSLIVTSVGTVWTPVPTKWPTKSVIVKRSDMIDARVGSRCEKSKRGDLPIGNTLPDERVLNIMRHVNMFTCITGRELPCQKRQ